ncbi:MAG: hypothetical protein ACM3X5_01385 [Bacillota bacterium]
MRALAVAVVALVPQAIAGPPEASRADDSPWSAKAGYDYSVGKYGLQNDTTISTSSATATYDNDEFGIDVLVPYLWQRGPGRLITIGGQRPTVVSGPAQKSQGIGDVTVTGTRYLLDEERAGFDLDLGAIVKFGTASASKGLGTGKNDLSLQAAFGKSIRKVDSTLTVGYTFAGKTSIAPLRDSYYASADARYTMKAASVGATYNYAQAAVAGTEPSRDASFYVEFKPFQKTRMELYYLKGWSTQSPDRGGGVSVACDF